MRSSYPVTLIKRALRGRDGACSSLRSVRVGVRVLADVGRFAAVRARPVGDGFGACLGPLAFDSVVDLHGEPVEEVPELLDLRLDGLGGVGGLVDTGHLLVRTLGTASVRRKRTPVLKATDVADFDALDALDIGEGLFDGFGAARLVRDDYGRE